MRIIFIRIIKVVIFFLGLSNPGVPRSWGSMSRHGVWRRRTCHHASSGTKNFCLRSRWFWPDEPDCRQCANPEGFKPRGHILRFCGHASTRLCDRDIKQTFESHDIMSVDHYSEFTGFLGLEISNPKVRAGYRSHPSSICSYSHFSRLFGSFTSSKELYFLSKKRF